MDMKIYIFKITIIKKLLIADNCLLIVEYKSSIVKVDGITYITNINGIAKGQCFIMSHA